MRNRKEADIDRGKENNQTEVGIKHVDEDFDDSHTTRLDEDEVVDEIEDGRWSDRDSNHSEFAKETLARGRKESRPEPFEGLIGGNWVISPNIDHRIDVEEKRKNHDGDDRANGRQSS